MQRHTKTVFVSLLAVGSLTLIGVGASVASPTSSKTRTLRFTSVQVASHNIPHNRFINTDTDRSQGKYVGSDVFEGTLNTKTFGVSTIDSFALKGGFIFAHTRTTGASRASGKVTGGTGKYKGIKGTIVVSGSQDSPEVTIRYHG
jgi:hypothetical protein